MYQQQSQQSTTTLPLTTWDAKFKEIHFLSEVEETNTTLKAVLLIHSLNIASGQLVCTGRNEDDEVEKGTILPDGWKESKEGVYSFRYEAVAGVSQDKTKNMQCLFKIIVGETQVNVNAIVLDANSVLHTTTISLAGLTAPSKEVMEGYQKEILDKLLPPKKKQSGLTPVIPQTDNRRDYVPMDVPRTHWQQQQQPQYMNGLRDYGRSDLNPFASGDILGSGSSLIGPNHPMFAGQQRPTGARFDPLGPQGFNGIPDDIQPGFFPNPNGQRGPFGGSRGGGGGFGGPFGGRFGGGLGDF